MAGAKKKMTANPYSEVLNGKRPKADARLLRDILNASRVPQKRARVMVPAWSKVGFAKPLVGQNSGDA